MKLLILNYSMDKSSMVFSHQREVARRLSKQFSSTCVITADDNVGENLPGISVFSSRWGRGQRLLSILKFYRVSLPIIFKSRKDLMVFSHMTEVQSFLIAPLCRILQIPHYLWYAHTSKSFFLFASYPLLSGVITSTAGSCPLKGKKVYPIGQAIDESILKGRPSDIQFPPLRWYHVGRIDPSKHIDLLISVFTQLRAIGWDLSLDIYGAPSSETSSAYLDFLLEKYEREIKLGWLHFRGPVQRDQLFTISNNHDGFVHGFQGSLDKAVLEAILFRRIVVSINPEYIKEFMKDEPKGINLQETLFFEMSDALNKTPEASANAIQTKYESCRSNHTLDRWIVELCKVLKNGK